MEILDLEVIYCDWRFQDLMLHPLNDYIFAIYQDEDIACPEVDSIRPAFDG